MYTFINNNLRSNFLIVLAAAIVMIAILFFVSIDASGELGGDNNDNDNYSNNGSKQSFDFLQSQKKPKKTLISQTYYQKFFKAYVFDQSVSGKIKFKTKKVYPAPFSSAPWRGLNPIVTTLFSLHTKEAVTVFKNKKPHDLLLDELFRCRGFGYSIHLDTRLIDIIIKAAIEFKSPRVDIISAYRSPKFNAALLKKGRRVALESKHTKGKAIDFRLKTVKAAELGIWLWDNFAGGVGTYKNDNFVHVDVGAKRKWNGK